LITLSSIKLKAYKAPRSTTPLEISRPGNYRYVMALIMASDRVIIWDSHQGQAHPFIRATYLKSITRVALCTIKCEFLTDRETFLPSVLNSKYLETSRSVKLMRKVKSWTVLAN
jgi:hypothetical protein